MCHVAQNYRRLSNYVLESGSVDFKTADFPAYEAIRDKIVLISEQNLNVQPLSSSVGFA